MKITLEHGILDLPESFSFSMEYNHPFYSDAGTSSVPVTVPQSAVNTNILDRPDNLCRADMFKREQSAFLECGAIGKRCTLVVDSSGDKGISMSLALRESEMYARNQDNKLKNLFADRSYGMTKMNISSPYEIYTGQFRGASYLNDVALFPVASDRKIDSNGATEIFVINKPSGSTIVDNPRTVSIGDSQVSVPSGYGVSPYLYLWACVQYCFESLGYEVRTNELKTDFDLKEIVLLNDFADVCCPDYKLPSFWSFQYADLVPDITLGEFIVWLHDKFGIFITCDSDVVDIRLFETCASASAPDFDLTPYISGTSSIKYPEQKGLQLSVETSIEGAKPAAESLEELRGIYTNCARVNKYSDIKGVGLFFVNALGRYYYRDSAGTISPIGTDAYDYKRSQFKESEDFSPNDLFVPMVIVDGVYMPYIGERSHRYIQAGEPTEQAIKICYAHYLKSGIYSGSTNTYGKDGNPHMVSTGSAMIPKGYLSLVPESLKKAFWHSYESALLNGAPIVSAEFDIPLHVLLSLDLATMKRFSGTNVFIKDLSYTFNDVPVSHVQATLQVMPEYQHPVYSPDIRFDVSYRWNVENTREIFDNPWYAIIEYDGLTDYTDADAPTYLPPSAGIKTKVRKRHLIYIKRFLFQLEQKAYVHYWEEYFISEFGE